MRIYMVLMAALLLSTGCASIAEVCANSYDYDRCYAEQSDLRQRRAAAAAAFSQGMRQNQQQQAYQIPVNKPVHTNCNMIGNQMSCTSY